MSEKRAGEIFSGTFLIGLAVLFLTGWWWPGILFVVGGALIVRTVAQGKPWTEERGGLAALAIGVLFTLTDVINVFDFNWFPLILIGLGVYLLLGNRWRGGSRRDDIV